MIVSILKNVQSRNFLHSVRFAGVALVCLFSCGIAQAQTSDDPVIMTIAGKPVLRSEFEYSYNKNNSAGVIDKKTVDEYVPLFVDYKLKVLAALDVKLDTVSAFRKEFENLRDQQVRPSFVTDADMETEARKYYDGMAKAIGDKGLFSCSHILLLVPQKASEAKRDSVKLRIDSVYNALQSGADFGEIAKKLSEDPGSARRGGYLGGPYGPGTMVKEFEDVAYSLKDDEISKPFLSPYGYHIIKMVKREQLPSYDSLHANILRFFEQRQYREVIAKKNVEKLAKDEGVTPEQVYAKRTDEMCAKDNELNNLIREYHDGLLDFAISDSVVWTKASKDEAGLERYFKANKKKYKWDTPRFKGIAYHVKDAVDVKAVRDCVKSLPFKDWAEALRKTFNSDKTIRIRVEKGIFKEGDNALVDSVVFDKKNVKYKPLKDYPIDATFGKKIKMPQEMDDVRGQVVSDYQDELMKTWVESLRKKYPVSINKEVLATVNAHGTIK